MAVKAKETSTETAKAPRKYTLPEEDVVGLLERAKQEFYRDPNVIGVGIGRRRKGNETHEGEIALVVYVREKLRLDDVDKDNRIPGEFEGMGTDVVAPFDGGAPVEALGLSESHQHSDDMSFIDWPRIHEQHMAELGPQVGFGGKIQDYGDVGVIEDDGTLVTTIGGTQVVDFVRAYKLFRTEHPDIYDFVTFFTDTASGMPPQGGSSWYRFVFNDTQGIGFGGFNQRPSYGTSRLQGIMFLNQGHFPVWRYVMLQEQGHRWGSFARYRESAGGAIKTDHMLGGWGHWALELDDDASPMDYDIYDWQAEGANFRRVARSSAERVYCNLDLYLMGLLGPSEVGDIYLLSGINPIGGNLFSATKKRLTLQNFLWAEGARIPSAATSRKRFKNAFVVLTKDRAQVHDLVDRVDGLRLRFERDFAEATKGLGYVDTTIGPESLELTASQIQQLVSGVYTGLHRHFVRPDDLRITGTQFSGSLAPGASALWFTHSWPDRWHVDWLVIPRTVAGGGPKIDWDVQTERTTSGITYWIRVRNVGSIPISYEARYSITR